ncbi:flavodoxin family protein [Desulforhopalus vacuolatus]|uniref:flavodoxin family protein n=1 Tax=Desulforhopalus vacuolatus TaxID=40414 RepID=UPI001964BF07|nr:flavodoxin family protein [Desulforhopalus vacuolatus]MBM9518612.1 flavodoxin family protein [Desulforhopalus vacuolatus]
MYALAVNGSPRKGGNTEMLLEEVLKPLKSAGWGTRIVQIGGNKIRGCLACGKCWEKKNMECAIKTDVFNDLFQEILQADAIIFGSPTYFADVTSEMKALLDRTGFVGLANNNALRGKIGAAVVANRRGGALHVYDTINHMFQINQMILPGSTYWNMGVGLAKGDVAEDTEALANMKNLGEIIAWLGKAVKPHMDSFPSAAGHDEAG